jgi:hypothetical protein
VVVISIHLAGPCCGLLVGNPEPCVGPMPRHLLEYVNIPETPVVPFPCPLCGGGVQPSSVIVADHDRPVSVVPLADLAPGGYYSRLGSGPSPAQN